jgi:hypothetical protein
MTVGLRLSRRKQLEKVRPAYQGWVAGKAEVIYFIRRAARWHGSSIPEDPDSFLPIRQTKLIVRCFLCVRGAAGAFHEAGVADASAVFQGKVDAAGWVDIGATFSAAVFVVTSIALIV